MHLDLIVDGARSEILTHRSVIIRAPASGSVHPVFMFHYSDIYFIDGPRLHGNIYHWSLFVFPPSTPLFSTATMQGLVALHSEASTKSRGERDRCCEWRSDLQGEELEK